MLGFKRVNSLLVVLMLFFTVFQLSAIWYVALVVLWLLITALGSGLIQWNYHLKSLNSNFKVRQNHVAITFDDGPHPDFTPKVLRLLDKYKAKATFFCVGKHIEKHPEVFKSILAAGHTVGNHSYYHTNTFSMHSSKKMVAEITQTNTVVKSISGLELHLFRPPFGVTNPNVKKALQLTGLVSVGWSKRSLDTTKRPQEKVIQRITANLQKGDVILLHDTSEKSVRVLEQLLLFLQEQNMQSVTVNELFKINPYA